MASSKWKSFQELNEVVASRPFVFWGASNWIERTLESLTQEPVFIVDKSELNHGIVFNGFNVVPPSEIILKQRPFVVITTVNYMSVIDELHEMGFVMGEDFCCTPLLNKREAKDNLQNHKASVLVSSSQHFADESAGGGLYKVDLNPFNIQKVYVGKGRGITRLNGTYYLIDMLRGIVILDDSFNETGVIELQKNSEPHGIFADPVSNQLFVGQPGRDSVAAYDIESRKLVREYFISDKWSKNKKDNHHVNDPFVYDGSLYVSMFSFTGNWLNEVYDGGVLEMDLASGAIRGPVFTDMWMPHSVTRVDGKLTLLNSMVGELWSASYGKLTETHGFARGLDFDGSYFYIGMTEHRYPEKLAGIRTNINMNTGFFVFDPETKMSRFVDLPFIESIHAVLVI